MAQLLGPTTEQFNLCLQAGSQRAILLRRSACNAPPGSEATVPGKQLGPPQAPDPSSGSPRLPGFAPPSFPASTSDGGSQEDSMKPCLAVCLSLPLSHGRACISSTPRLAVVPNSLSIYEASRLSRGQGGSHTHRGDGQMPHRQGS